jgi:hypothetical protein
MQQYFPIQYRRSRLQSYEGSIFWIGNRSTAGEKSQLHQQFDLDVEISNNPFLGIREGCEPKVYKVLRSRLHSRDILH